MNAQVSNSELQDILARCLGEEVDDLHSREVSAFVSGLITSVGLRAVNMAFDARARGEPVVIDTFSGADVFNFDELPRADLIHALEATTGLTTHACDVALSALRDELLSRISDENGVTVERLGTVAPTSTGAFRLRLDRDLEIVESESSGQEHFVSAVQ